MKSRKSKLKTNVQRESWHMFADGVRSVWGDNNVNFNLKAPVKVKRRASVSGSWVKTGELIKSACEYEIR